MPVVLCAAALAFGGFEALHTDGGQTTALRRALTLLSRPNQAKAAERLLEQARRSGSRPVRSQASNVLAAVLLERGKGRTATQAMQLYADAIRLDATDDASKFDLELLLTLRGGQSRQRGKRRSSSANRVPAREHPIPGGAGQASGGQGY